MNKVYLAFTCNTWHQRDSFSLIGAGASWEDAIEIVKTKAAKEGNHISDDDMHLLNTIRQTQGYEGSGEFVMEEWEVQQFG